MQLLLENGPNSLGENMAVVRQEVTKVQNVFSAKNNILGEICLCFQRMCFWHIGYHLKLFSVYSMQPFRRSGQENSRTLGLLTSTKVFMCNTHCPPSRMQVYVQTSQISSRIKWKDKSYFLNTCSKTGRNHKSSIWSMRKRVSYQTIQRIWPWKFSILTTALIEDAQYFTWYSSISVTYCRTCRLSLITK